MKFDYIIVDEAAQIKEFQIVGLCDKDCRLIMAGDQHQLPPFYENVSNRDNCKSLFEILQETHKQDENFSMALNTQY